MTDQDRAAQVLRTFPLFVSKLFTQDERQDAISAIAAYGQERYRAGVEDLMLHARRGQLVLGGHIAVPLNYLENGANKLLAEQEKP